MTKIEYENALKERLPDWPLGNEVYRKQLNMVDIVRKAAEYLFMDGDVNSDVARETRKQLANLQQDGIITFDK